MHMATTLLRPDQTFYPSPRLAGEAPVETLAYMVTFDPTAKKPDALVTLDVDPNSATFGKQAGRVEMPHVGDELHHFGWNACSSALCPYAPHPHIERRYLLVPGLRSSRIYVFDVNPTLASRSSCTPSSPRRSLRGRGTAALTPSTAALTASTSAPWALPMATAPAASSSSTTTISR